MGCEDSRYAFACGVSCQYENCECGSLILFKTIMCRTRSRRNLPHSITDETLAGSSVTNPIAQKPLRARGRHPLRLEPGEGRRAATGSISAKTTGDSLRYHSRAHRVHRGCRCRLSGRCARRRTAPRSLSLSVSKSRTRLNACGSCSSPIVGLQMWFCPPPFPLPVNQSASRLLLSFSARYFGITGLLLFDSFIVVVMVIAGEFWFLVDLCLLKRPL